MGNKSQRVSSPIKIIFGYVGVCILIVGISLMLNLLTLIPYPEEMEYAKCFYIPGIISIIVGAILFLPIYKKDKTDLDKNHDYVIVIAAWIMTILICAVPYFLTGEYNFTESIFESTSGLTTCGFTVVDVDNAPKIILMHRGITLYLGGIGMILIMTAIFSTAFGMRLYNAEGHPNKLIPNLIKSARLMLVIYTGYIISGAILYVVFGMPVFDAINHSIAAVANGGFSTKSQSIGFYNSIPIELITSALAILGGTNFLVNLLLIRGKWKAVFKHCETKVVFLLCIVFIPMLAFILLSSMYATFGESFRTALFYIITTMMGTGFAIQNSYLAWPSAAVFILILMMILGGQTGSTSGGFKSYRIAVSFKSFWYDLKSKLLKKNEITSQKINLYGNDEVITSERTMEANNFIVVYLFVLLTGTFLFMLAGYPLMESLFEFASALSCVGLSYGITGIGASTFVNWVAIIGMIVGRLDIYPVLIAMLTFGNDSKNLVKKFAVKGRKNNV